MRDLVESSSTRGEKVLDPCVGTGATGVAAVLSGRSIICIELEIPWADEAARRLAEAARIRARMDAA